MRETDDDNAHSSGAGDDIPRWFERMGTPLEERERRAIAEILARHGFPQSVEIVAVASWSEVRALLDLEARDSRLWDAQEAERERLWELGTDRQTEADLLDALGRAEAHAREALRAGAVREAGRLGVNDDGRLAAEATGAAQLAVHHAALAALAGAGDVHPFHATLAVFACGRWPLGLSGNRFYIF